MNEIELCAHCGAAKEEHDYEHLARECMPEQIKRLKEWVDDCQSDMHINCVYCGHRYGPGVPATTKEDAPDNMKEALRRHIEQCPEHPMSKLRTALAAADALYRVAKKVDLERMKAAATNQSFEYHPSLFLLRDALANYEKARKETL